MESVFQISEKFVEQILTRTVSAIHEVEKDDVRKDFYFFERIGQLLEPIVRNDVIKILVQHCLQASLEREEDSFNSFAVTLEPQDPEYSREQFVFETPIPFSATSLKKLASAINPNKYHIGVWLRNGKLEIWGYKQNILSFISISSLSPGKITYTCIAGIDSSFKCLITFSQSGFLNPMDSDSPLRKWLSRQYRDISDFQKLVDLHYAITRIFDLGKGGTILLTKAGTSKFLESLNQPLLYRIKNPSIDLQFPQLQDKQEMWKKMQSNANLDVKLNTQAKVAFRNELSLKTLEAKYALDNIANLSTVDGAVLLDENFTLIGFGAKIVIPEKEQQDLLYRHSYETDLKPTRSSECGGMRHQSAISFISEQHDCLAIVVSEDKRVSLFYWDESKKSVVQIRNYELIAVR